MTRQTRSSTTTARSTGRRLLAAALAVPLLGLANPIPAGAADGPPPGPGQRDPTFGDGGLSTHTPAGYAGGWSRAAAQPDGKILVPGRSLLGGRSVLRLTRFEANGAVDSGFGTTGSVTTPVGAYAHANGVAVQPDGKIVVAGGTSATASGPSDFVVARYDPTGALDASFGGTGFVVTDFSGSSEYALDVAVQPDGAVVVAGERYDEETSQDFAVARYTSGGQLDTSFAGGKVSLPLTVGDEWPRALALQPDGGIVVTGTTDGGESGPNAFATVRLTPGGALDPTFSGDGVAYTDAGEDEREGAIALQADGKIVIGGNTWPEGHTADEFALVRYGSDGELDTSFGEDGLVLTDIGARGDVLGDIAVQTVVEGGQPVERIVAAGSARGESPADVDFALARYDADGDLDTSFGPGGIVVTEVAGTDNAFDVVIQGDNIVAVGSSTPAPSAIALARYVGVQAPPEEEPEPCVDQTIELAGRSVHAEACFTHPEPTVWQATGDVRVNGIDLSVGGTATFDAAAPSLTVTGGVTVGVGEFTLYAGGELSWDLSGEVSLALPETFTLKGFPVQGSATLSWADAEATLVLEVGLPEVLGGITASGTLTANMEDGLQLDSLGVTIGEAQIGGRLGVKDVGVSYSFSDDEWTGTGVVVLPSGLEIGGTFVFGGDGGFRSGDASIGGINHLVGAGVFLQEISFGIDVDPLELRGGAVLTAGPEIEGVAAARLDGDLSYALGDPDTLRVEGALDLFETPFADGFIEYRTTGDIDLGGQLELEAAGVGVSGGLEGWISGLEAFNIEGDVTVDLPFVTLRGRAVASTRGLAACATVDTFWGRSYSAGIGYKWGERAEYLKGCDLGQYVEEQPRARDGMAPTYAGSQFELAGGMPVAAFAITGDAAPPQVTLVGPNGERISGATEGLSAEGHLVVADHDGNATYMAVASPAGGTWTLEVDKGSADVVGVRHADGLPRPEVKASASPGVHLACLCVRPDWVLDYDVRPQPGQTVTFAEVGAGTARVIGTATAESGTLSFTPAAGPGERQIVAVVEQDGMPRENITVGTYTV